MKKLLMIVLCVALCVSVFALTACGGVGLAGYSNKVDRDEIIEMLLDAVEEYGYDDSDTFEKSYTYESYSKSVEVSKTEYDSGVITERTTTEISTEEKKYDSVNEVATTSRKYSEEVKDTTYKRSTSGESKSWYQQDGNDVAYSYDPMSKMYREYEDDEILDHVSSASIYNNIYNEIDDILIDAYHEDEDEDFEFYVDGDVFTVVMVDRYEYYDYEEVTESTYQLVFSDNKAEIKGIKTITSTEDYDDYTVTTTRTIETRMTLNFTNVTLAKEDLSKYNKYE